MLELNKSLDKIVECYDFKNPYNLTYLKKEKRLESFKSWNKSISKIELSEAGFYWNGKNDEVICFHCGVGLKNWEESDDPWEQHAYWGKNCLFLQLKKGKSFITTVCNTFNTLLTLKSDKNNIYKSLNCINDKTLCKVCFTKPLEILFLPCKHLSTCMDCTMAVQYCPICRKKPQYIMNIYLS